LLHYNHPLRVLYQLPEEEHRCFLKASDHVGKIRRFMEGMRRRHGRLVINLIEYIVHSMTGAHNGLAFPESLKE